MRSTRVTRQLLPSPPTTRSPSQWPGTARSAASGGLSEISWPETHGLPGRAGSLERGLRDRLPLLSACSQASSCLSAPLPCTYRAWYMVSWLILMAPLSGKSALMRSDICLGDHARSRPATT